MTDHARPPRSSRPRPPRRPDAPTAQTRPPTTAATDGGVSGWHPDGAAPDRKRAGPALMLIGNVASSTWAGGVLRELARCGRDTDLALALEPTLGYLHDPNWPLPAICDRLAHRRPPGATRCHVGPAFALHPDAGKNQIAVPSFDANHLDKNELATLRRFAAVCVPTAAHEQALRDAGLTSTLCTLPPAVDQRAFQPRRPPHPEIADGKRFRFLFIGSPVWRKGLELALRAYLETFTNREAVELILVLTHIPKLKKDKSFEMSMLAHQLGALHSSLARVRVFTGPRDATEMGTIMTAGNVLLVPSRRVHTGQIVREAAACALPVLAPTTVTQRVGFDPTTAIPIAAHTIACPAGALYPESPAGKADEIDIAAMKAAMRTAFAQPNATRRLGLQARARLVDQIGRRGDWSSWMHVLQEQLTRRPEVPAKPGRTPPPRQR